MFQLQMLEEIKVVLEWVGVFAGISTVKKVANMGITVVIYIRIPMLKTRGQHVFKTIQCQSQINHDVSVDFVYDHSIVNVSDVFVENECDVPVDIEVFDVDAQLNRAGMVRSAVDWEPSHLPPVSKMTLCWDKWKEELDPEYVKTSYILEGIKHGFLINDCFLDIVSSVRSNYNSTFLPDAIESVEKQIRLEMELGRYIVCDNLPYIVSSLGAIPKTDKRVRLIHDLSQPFGGPNKFAEDTSVCYATIDDAVRLIVPGSYLGKLDLSSAYRSVPIHPDCFCLTGLQWTFVGDQLPTYFYDARLPFGASKACAIFQGLSDAVVMFMEKRNFHVISYIDDFLCVEDSYDR
jgi:hypothetical protein